MPAPLKFLLYELAVTNARRLAAFAHAVHAGTGRRSPRTLREDFSGTGALARAWLAAHKEHRAIVVDKDPGVTRHIPAVDRLRVRTADASKCRARADIIAATNFAVGYFHERGSLLRYLRNACACLTANGVCFCDIYGGPGAWTVGTQRVRVHPERTDERQIAGVPRSFVYEWQQHTADPLTGLVENAIHFSWREGKRTRRLDRAFTYHWRLWSIHELRDIMHEAGFHDVLVYTRLADAVDHEGNAHVAPAEPDDVRGDFVAYVIARR